LFLKLLLHVFFWRQQGLLISITKTKSLAGNNGLSMFYREPECYNNPQGYSPGILTTAVKQPWHQMRSSK
jgi:hypothetical protein